MALVITKTETGQQDGRSYLISYDNLDEADIAPAAIELVDFSDQSVQVVGTFNAGTVVIQGSNDGTNWVTVLDPANAAISFTSAGLKKISTPVKFLRPLVSAGTGVDVDVFFLLRKVGR